MTTNENSFRKRLKCQFAIKEPKQLAEEQIKRELFRIVCDYDLDDGNTIHLKEIVNIISDRLGLQRNKKQIAEFIRRVLKSEIYKVKINDNDIIEVILNEQEKRTKQYQDNQKRIADLEFAKFVGLVETYVNQLEKQNIKITEQNIKNQFSEELRENDFLWVDLAIGKVLREKNQENQI